MKYKKETAQELILKQGMLPLYYHQDLLVSIQVLKALYAAGIRAVEYTNRGSAALENFKGLVTLRDTELRDLQLGIGTIKTVADAASFIEAGADFIICPGLIPEVIRHTHESGLLCIPGCMTTSEIIAAEQEDVTFIKLFPGNLIGPGYMTAIRDIFPGIHFMPTGGVDTTAENIREWFLAGVSAVGMGSKLISKKLMEDKAYDEIQSLAAQTLTTVQSVRKSL